MGWPYLSGPCKDFWDLYVANEKPKKMTICMKKLEDIEGMLILHKGRFVSEKEYRYISGF